MHVYSECSYICATERSEVLTLYFVYSITSSIIEKVNNNNKKNLLVILAFFLNNLAKRKMKRGEPLIEYSAMSKFTKFSARSNIGIMPMGKPLLSSPSL